MPAGNAPAAFEPLWRLAMYFIVADQILAANRIIAAFKTNMDTLPAYIRK